MLYSLRKTLRSRAHDHPAAHIRYPPKVLDLDDEASIHKSNGWIDVIKEGDEGGRDDLRSEGEEEGAHRAFILEVVGLDSQSMRYLIRGGLLGVNATHRLGKLPIRRVELDSQARLPFPGFLEDCAGESLMIVS